MPKEPAGKKATLAKRGGGEKKFGVIEKGGLKKVDARKGKRTVKSVPQVM